MCIHPPLIRISRSKLQNLLIRQPIHIPRMLVCPGLAELLNRLSLTIPRSLVQRRLMKKRIASINIPAVLEQEFNPVYPASGSREM